MEGGGGNDASGGRGSCRTLAQQHPVCPSLHRNEAELVDDSTEGNTLATGVMSMFFGSTRDFGGGIIAPGGPGPLLEKFIFLKIMEVDKLLEH